MCLNPVLDLHPVQLIETDNSSFKCEKTRQYFIEGRSSEVEEEEAELLKRPPSVAHFTIDPRSVGGESTLP